jgi:hypothetical protein
MAQKAVSAQKAGCGCLTVVVGIIFLASAGIVYLPVQETPSQQIPSEGMASSSISSEGTIPSQKYNPSLCSDTDQHCFRSWYDEYKIGIIEEFKFYRSLEDDAAIAIRNRDQMLAARILGTLIKGGYYKHNHWVFASGSAAIQALTAQGIQYKTYGSLWDCRSAILAMKYLLISIENHPEEIANDRTQYIASARKCERGFGLKPAASALRK